LEGRVVDAIEHLRVSRVLTPVEKGRGSVSTARARPNAQRAFRKPERLVVCRWEVRGAHVIAFARAISEAYS